MKGSGNGEKETGNPAGVGGVAEESPTFNVPFSQSNNAPLHVERELGGLESCMGDGGLNRKETAGSVSKMGGDLGTIFNYDSFLEKGNGATCSDVGYKGLFVFKSGKKSKRRGKVNSKSQNVGSFGSPNCLLDSSEKSRPTKRSRAQVENVSDPCSFDKVQGLMKDKNNRGEDGSSIGEHDSGSVPNPTEQGNGSGSW
ncbi:hypothetical protein Hanom_Chr01g00006281 [Helianthus anomalus]